MARKAEQKSESTGLCTTVTIELTPIKRNLIAFASIPVLVGAATVGAGFYAFVVYHTLLWLFGDIVLAGLFTALSCAALLVAFIIVCVYRAEESRWPWEH